MGMNRVRNNGAACIGIGLALFMTACGSGTNTPPPPPTTYVLTVNSTNPASGVAIGVSPADVNGATSGSTAFTRTYDSGASVTLTAPTPSGGATFASWSGCSSASTVTCTVTMNANTTVTANYTALPSITSFMANPTTIGSGASTSLTGVFANGTGVITPGNLAATSGTAVSVSPTTTTTYTLTVTPTIGTAVTQTVTVTVVPAPTISICTAFQTTIGPGANSSLTGVFANGTGVITPGNVAVTSGTAVSVSQTTTTTYTLTVTPTIGTAVTQTVAVTVVPAPTITSFTANPTTIGSGASTSLTGVFANGTGVVTPGNLAVTSGTPVSVSPMTSTVYTLTVTPPAGTAVTQTVSVTVGPAPTITSFTASPATITSGASTNLTGVFANGTGVITPGNLPATSGTAVSVSPTTTTTYTLTVTPTSGTAVTQTVTVTLAAAAITVNQSVSGPAVTNQLLGMNMAVWNDATFAQAVAPFQAAGIKAVRWPGGSTSDTYHWEGAGSNPSNPSICPSGSYAFPSSTFANFVNDLAIPAGLDIALTANYGSNETCNGGGDPNEAAAWVTNALSLGVTVSHMTVGNEEYGSWEYDLHAKKNDPPTFTSAVAGTSGFYALVKAASPNTLVGVEVEPNYAPWDQDVMSGAPYDFVEYHYYPETPGSESDTFIVHSAAQGLTTNINKIKSELTKWGTPNTPIYVGEIGGPYSNPGKQSWSITQGLYAGQVLGEMMNVGVSRLTWWIGFGNCNGTSGNLSTSLYGWQNFGAYNVFSDGTADSTCPGAGPVGTQSPTAEAFSLFQNVAVTGENVLTATVAGDTADVRAYAATHSGGTALVLFNLNETVSEPITVTLSAQTTASTVTVETYDKAIYDLSGSPTGFFPDPAGTSTWAPPTTTTISSPTLPLSLTLAPWSMNVVTIH